MTALKFFTAALLAGFSMAPVFAKVHQAHKPAVKTGAGIAAGSKTDLKKIEKQNFKELKKRAESEDADAQFELAEIYYSGQGAKQDYKKAFQWYEKSAGQKTARALFKLGLIYDAGKGVARNPKKALSCYYDLREQYLTKAIENNGETGDESEETYKDVYLFPVTKEQADAGDTAAQAKVGQMYLSGEGTERDTEKAFEYLSKAADSGIADAQFSMGRLYWEGEGVKKSQTEAVQWYEKAAEQNRRYQERLGDMYAGGVNFIKDYKKAVKWYTKAAESGSPDAQSDLGSIYTELEDYFQAYKWLILALRNESIPAYYSLAKANGRLTQTQIEEAQLWAEGMFKKNQGSF